MVFSQPSKKSIFLASEQCFLRPECFLDAWKDFFSIEKEVFSKHQSGIFRASKCFLVICENFDISTTDNDDDWTEAPWLHDSCTHHIRMVSDDQQGLEDIVLDGGADVSALLLSFADVGVLCTHDGSLFVDVQGWRLIRPVLQESGLAV